MDFFFFFSNSLSREPSITSLLPSITPFIRPSSQVGREGGDYECVESSGLHFTARVNNAKESWGFFECKAAGGAAGFTGNTLALELESPYYCSRL